MNHDSMAALLVSLARSAIERELTGGDAPAPEPAAGPELEAPAATFVTLTLDGELRGCIGSLEARRSLADDVADNARAAAFEDPRFSPLTADELGRVRVEVSVLSEPVQIEARSEAEVLAALRSGIDGLVLEYGAHRATYLPQVWRSLPEPEGFLAGLKRKAGLEPDFWSGEMRFSRYTVEKYVER